ncbi:MAG: succinate dehydrogenase cytochrome b subunit [Myxococcales bacterium]|nr:succinate dehydrogenase cytochrome b subunit [Myxococcales bacterium]
MSATTADRISSFYQTSIGKKVVMAATGVILFGFLVGHLLGNVQIFAGADKFNAYAEFLHNTPSLLWGTRIVLLLSLFGHVTAVVQLYRARAEARPVQYKVKRNRGATLASRLMLVSGVAVFAFIIFHLLHFTTGTVHGDFKPDDPAHNLISAFTIPTVALAYVVAMGLVAMHLYHGLWSFTQSLGVSHPRYTGRIKASAMLVSVALCAAFASIPILILAHYVK